MSTFVKAPIRTHVRFVGALLMAWTLGCGDRVNLGDVPLSPPTDADGGTGDDGSLVTLLRFDANLRGCNGIVADDTYLYFSTFEQDGPSVHRCRKTDCGATLTRVARAPCADCAYEVMERVAIDWGSRRRTGSTRMGSITLQRARRRTAAICGRSSVNFRSWIVSPSETARSISASPPIGRSMLADSPPVPKARAPSCAGLSPAT